MEFLSSWLLGITGAAILAALAEELMPPGPVKRVGQLVCALVLIIALLSPFGRLDLSSLGQAGESWKQSVDENAAQLEQTRQGQLKMVIEERCAAYIVDKAEEMGYACAVRVTCRADGDGLLIPVHAEISGSLSPEGEQAVGALASDGLGIAAQEIVFTEEEER